MRVRSFTKKNSYIFGGSSGIGLAVAGRLAQNGAHVYLFARNPDRLQSAVETVKGRTQNPGQQVVGRSVDVSDARAVQNVVQQTAFAFGPPEILMNSAGRAHPDHFESIDAARFEETLQVNLLGTRHTIQAALPYLKKTGGVILNVSSVAGFIGVFGYTDYAASKFAVLGFSEALRSELKPHNILVSVLCPPDTRTPGLEAENLTKPEETRAIAKRGGILEVETVADAVIKGLKKGKTMIIPGWDARLTWYLKRWFPWLVARVIDHSIRQVQQKYDKR